MEKLTPLSKHEQKPLYDLSHAPSNQPDKNCASEVAINGAALPCTSGNANFDMHIRDYKYPEDMRMLSFQIIQSDTYKVQ